MLRFALYALALSALFSAAGWTLERAQIAASRPRRWVWLTAMLATICAPAVNQFMPARFVPVHITAPAAASAPAHVAQTEQAAVTATVRIEHTAKWQIPQLPSVDRLLQLAWIAASCALLLSYLCAMFVMQRRARNWNRREIDGHAVLSSGDVGPAVIGVLKNRIVVPNWIFHANPQVRSIALMHEQQHIRGRDSVMLNAALLCAIAMPWNVLLWWQLRRLRFAIEADCDRRVLAAGIDVADYGDALLTIGRHRHGLAFGAISVIEPISQLERRIKSMTKVHPSRPKLIASAWAVCCATVVAFAGQIDRPEANGLRLPPPGGDLQYALNQIVQDAFPDLFKQHLAQPVSLKLILNNDLSIDYSEKKLWPVGTPMEVALPSPSNPTAGFDASLLDANDPLSLHQIKQTSTEGEPVFIHVVIRGIHKSRTAHLIRAALKKTHPSAYAKAIASNEVLLALFDRSGDVKRVSSKRIQGTLSPRDLVSQLSGLGASPTDIAVVNSIGPSTTPVAAPTIIYGFPLTGRAEVDANPLSPVAPHMRQVQRALAEKYFPALANDSVLAHELLWIAMNPRGEVLSSGSSVNNPETLSSQFDRIAPHSEVIARQTLAANDLFGRKIVDTQREPVLISYLWVRPATVGSGEVMVDVKIYRDGTLLHDESARMRFGEPHSFQIEGMFRLQLTGTDLSKEMELHTQVQVDSHGHSDLSDPWETAAQPILRVGYGEKAAIELGVQYPDQPKGSVWRIEVTPTRLGER